ncbi:MAG: hypothetical protein K0R14_1731 [Burkholderiales bacterium]|jgi:uncharacterized membrane protein YdjX (TVP38/TMEM64 family)|nr:hypothetical protein [Burkholderiales bacterium]
MKQGLLKIGILLLVIAFFIAVVKYYHLNDYLSLEGFNNYRNRIIGYEINHPAIFIMGYVVLYIALIIVCIPGTILFDLIAGFVFGYYFGTLIVIFCYGIGSFLNFLLVRYFFKNLLAHRFSRFKTLIHGSGRHGLLINLIGLRLIAVIPFWILNIVAALLNINARTFLISTLIGILPSTIIYVVIGGGVREMLNKGQPLTTELLMNPKIWVPVFIMAIIIMLPNIIKYYKQSKLRRNNNA